jgi:hypothetical protein
MYRVWLGNQAAYADRLIGEWVDAREPDELATAYDRVTRAGKDEHFVGDVEGPVWFRDMIGEWGSVEVIAFAASVADELESAGVDSDLFDAWWDCMGTSYGNPLKWDPAELVDAARDSLMAEGDSDTDAAMNYADEMFERWEYPYTDPRSCIDWEQYARHLQNDYSFVRVGGTVYILHLG